MRDAPGFCAKSMRTDRQVAAAFHCRIQTVELDTSSLPPLPQRLSGTLQQAFQKGELRFGGNLAGPAAFRRYLRSLRRGERVVYANPPPEYSPTSSATPTGSRSPTSAFPPSPTAKSASAEILTYFKGPPRLGPHGVFLFIPSRFLEFAPARGSVDSSL